MPFKVGDTVGLRKEFRENYTNGLRLQKRCYYVFATSFFNSKRKVSGIKTNKDIRNIAISRLECDFEIASGFPNFLKHEHFEYRRGMLTERRNKNQKRDRR